MVNVASNEAWPTGVHINESPAGVSEKWLNEFSWIPSAIISDCLGRSVGGLGLRPYHGAGSHVRFCDHCSGSTWR